MIRQATLEDKAQVVRLMSDFFHKTEYTFLGYDKPSLEDIFERLVTTESAAIFISDDYTGCIAGYVTPYWMNANRLFAQELFWYVDPSKRGTPVGVRLLDAFEKWSVEQKADAIAMSSTTTLNPEAVGKLYTRRGYTPIDISYIRKIRTWD